LDNSMEKKMNLNEWQIKDESNGLTFPYYTHGFLDMLSGWDISDWRVFEYGGGFSTLWWRDKVRECITIDSSPKWSQQMGLTLVSDEKEFVEYPLGLCEPGDNLFDCIVIDGDPCAWRDSCTAVALKSLKKGGTLIIDNWLQDTIPYCGQNDWIETRKLLQPYEAVVHQQHNHIDWKTACWIIND